MKNLDQIRAANALAASSANTFKGVNDGSIVKKIPTMIRENGFIGALAFACEKDKNGGAKNGDHHKVFEVILKHLRDHQIAVISKDVSDSVESLMEHVTSVSSDELREITAESMAYLSYLRRFVSAGD